MAELVYPPVVAFARTIFKVLGLRITVEGAEHIPRSGGAVLAANHVSYLDFALNGLVVLPSRRRIRYMAKDAVFRNPVAGPLMRGMHHIPVNRSAGAGAFDEAVAALKSGEIVGVFPEATISRAFALKDFKTGAARMAVAADVPLIPMATWGAQRIYTKGRRPSPGRGKAVALAVGEPFRPAPGADPAQVTAELKQRIADLLAGLQERYPQRPAGNDDRWWVPAAAGGSAPTLEEAREMDAADAAGRARRPPNQS